MKTAGKVWGSTSEIFATSTFELHRIVANKDHRCSRHKHDTKFNGFYVERGVLEVTVWQPTGTVDVTVLNPGDCMSVPPGVVHQFRALTPECVAYEAYWVELRSDDIYRFETGE